MGGILDEKLRNNINTLQESFRMDWLWYFLEERELNFVRFLL